MGEQQRIKKNSTRRRFIRRALSLMLTLAMVFGLIPGMPGQIEAAGAGGGGEPEFTLSEFHLTDSNWTDTGDVTRIDRHPAVSMKWTTTGLPEAGENAWYDADLFVAPYGKSTVQSAIKGLADMAGWPADDPRRSLISTQGNNYWQASVPKTSMTAEGGEFTHMLAGNFVFDQDACIQVGDTCTWQLLIYKRTKIDEDNTNSEVVLQTDMAETTVDWSAGLPYMNEDHMEIAFQWGSEDYLEPTSNVSYEAQIFVWPQQSIADPYTFPYGWVNSVRWSDQMDFNVLMQHGAWSDCLLEKDGVSAWFCNDEEMQASLGEGNSLTPVPGETYTTGVLIHKIDRSSGSPVVTEFRRSPAVEFTVTAGTGGGSGMGPGETSTPTMPESGTSKWKAAIMPVIDDVTILDYPTGNTGEIKMGVTFHFPNLPAGLKIEDVPGFNQMHVDIRGTHGSGELKKTGLLRPGEARVTSTPASSIEAITDYWDWAYLSDGKGYTIKTIDLVTEDSLSYTDEGKAASGVCLGDEIELCMNANGIIWEGGSYVGSYGTPDSTAAKFTVSGSIKDQSFKPAGSSSFSIGPESVYVNVGTYQDMDDPLEFDVNTDPDNPSLQEFTGGKWAVAVARMAWDTDLLYHVFPMKEDKMKVATGTPGYITFAKDKYSRDCWQWCNAKGTVLNPDNPWVGYNPVSIDPGMGSAGQIPVSVYQFPGTASSMEDQMKGFYEGEDLIVGIQAYVKSNPNCYSNLITVRIPLNESSKSKTFRPTDMDQPDDPEPTPTPVAVIQPSIGYTTRTMKSTELSDMRVSKADGSFTFDSLMCGDAVLTKDTDYTAAKGEVTIKKAYLEGLGAGEHVFTFHYTGTAGEAHYVPVDPVLKLTIHQMCTATLTVKDKDGAALNEDQYTVVWMNKANRRIVDPPIAVAPGTTLTYTVTPADSLKVDGVQYYKAASGEVAFTKDNPEVNIEAALGQQGHFTVTPKVEGQPLAGGYTVTWYEPNGYWKGEGLTSPLTDAGKKLKYEIRMTSTENKDRYNDVPRILTEKAVFGNNDLDVTIQKKTSIVLTLSANQEIPDLTEEDYTVIWYTSDVSGLTRYGLGRELKNVDVDTLYYEILPKDHDNVHNWIRFYPVPAGLETTKVTLEQGKENRVQASVEAVKRVSLSVNVTNGAGFNLNVTGSQAPWEGYSLQPNTSWYRNNGLNFTLERSDGTTYAGEVYDFSTSVKIMEQNAYSYPAGNYETAYRTISRKSAPNGKDMAAEVALIPAALPDSIGVSVTRKTPEYDTGWHDEGGEEVYGAYGLIRDYEACGYEEAAYFNWSLYNVTKDAPVPEEDYTVEYNRTGKQVKFNGEKILSSNSVSVGNVLRLTLTVSQGSVGHIHADIPETLESEVTVKKYWTDQDYREGAYRFHFAYDAWGRVSLETRADSSYYETYGIYDEDGSLAASGRKANWWKAASEELAPGTYTVCIWKETKWISTAPATLQGLKELLKEGEYQERTVTAANGQTVKAEPAFGISPEVPDRNLFTEDSGFLEELADTGSSDGAQLRLSYSVADSMMKTNPDGRYAIRVTMPSSRGSGPLVELKTTMSDTAGHKEGYDPGINLFVDGQLDTDSYVKVSFSVGRPSEFVLYTDQPKGEIYFSVDGGSPGMYTLNADGWLCGANDGTQDSYWQKIAYGALGSSVVQVLPSANCDLYFASDYLRMPDNGYGSHSGSFENGLWVYTVPYKIVHFYMDDVEIGSKKSDYNGMIFFSFKMDDALKAKFSGTPGWALIGSHRIYAETDLESGEKVRSQTYERECLSKHDAVRPAVLTGLRVYTLGEGLGEYYTKGEQLLEYPGYTGTSGRIYKSYTYYKEHNQGLDLKYHFEATVENPEWTDGDLILWLTPNSMENYRIPLVYDADKNVYVGEIDQDGLLFSMWEVTITSKKPAETGEAVDEATLAALGKDAATVTGTDLMEKALDGGNLVNPYTGQLQTMAEYEAWIESDIFGVNGLNLHSDDEIQNAGTDEEKAELLKENIEKLSGMILEDANAEMEMTESFFKNMAQILGRDLPEDLVFDGSLDSVKKLREYMGVNVYYPLAVLDTDDEDTKSVKNELQKYLAMTEEEQQQYGTIETALDGTKIRRFQRIMIETSETDHKPHLYSLYITIYTDFPDGLLPDWAEVDIVDGGVSEIEDLADTGTDLFAYMAGLTADDFSGGTESLAVDGLPEPSGYRPGEEPGNWGVKVQSFTEIAVFNQTKINKVEQLNAAMRQNNKDMNGGNQTNRQNQYWQQMKYWKQENNIQNNDAGSAEGSALTSLANNISDMIEQGQKSGKLTEAEINELKSLKKKVQEINDALTLNIAYEAGKGEASIYEEIQSTVDLLKNAGKAVQNADLGDLMNGYESMKDFAKDTAKDYAMEKGKESLYDSLDQSGFNARKYDPLYYRDKGLAWLAEKLFGENAQGAMDQVEQDYAERDKALKELAKLGLDPSRFIKEKADLWTREKFIQYEKDLDNIVDTLNNKFGLNKVRVKGGRNTSRNTNAGRSKACIDPSGIVYEAVLSNPVAGATATLYGRTGVDPDGISWNATDYGQINPQETGADGLYQWFVPEGEWQVRVTHPAARADLSDNTSADHPNANLDDGSTKGWLPVLPVQLGIHIPLSSNAAPEIMEAKAYKSGIKLQFSLYMDAATLSDNEIYAVTDGTNPIPCVVTFPDEDVSPADPSKHYARTVSLAPADGSRLDPAKQYSLKASISANAYNGKSLAEEYDSGMLPITIETVTVSFNMMGHGEPIASQTVETGETVQKPADPEAEGYRFAGWFTDPACTKAYDFALPVTESFTLYVGWIQKKTYTVSFDLNGRAGTPPAAQNVEEGASVSKPADPTAEGVDFTGWYREKECVTLYDFAKPVTSSFTLYAGWMAGGSEDGKGEADWNLYEDASEHQFTVQGINVPGTVENSNVNSKKYYDAKISGSVITVKVTGDRKKAAGSALLEFDLGENGGVGYALPVSYVKPVFKLSSASSIIKRGRETTLQTRVLKKNADGTFSPYDMKDVKVTGTNLGTVSVNGDGSISIKTSSAGKGKISIVKDSWDGTKPVNLSYIVKGSNKDVLDVDLGGWKSVVVNSNAKTQSFSFDVTLNGEAPAEGSLTLTEKKNSGLATLSGNRLVIAYKDGVKNGTYTVTLASGEAKKSVKIRVSGKALEKAVTTKVQQKYDVVTKQSMVVVPKLKDVGGAIESVSVEEKDFSARLNSAGSIVIGYSGNAYDAQHLNIGTLTLKLLISGVKEPVTLKLNKVKAKKTSPKVKAGTVTVPAGATVSEGKVIAAGNIVSTYKAGAEGNRILRPVKTEILGTPNGVTVKVNEKDMTEIDILSLSKKSAIVKVKLTYDGGMTKTVALKVKKKAK
ncbi:MAG: InlB B-repeat-containing protein [Lachnospiraceae bacterium]|nr:InlB B-repeat-containing protein [Lachnospiraceae bacterium]